jgi:Transposase DNA-binding
MTNHRPFCNEKRYLDEVAADDETWLDREVTECKFQDERLGKRFRILLERLWGSMGQSIPFACQDWANTKAAYRFLANDRVGEQDILSGHFQATRERFANSDGPVLVLQDTTTFSYQRDRPELIGFTGKSGSVRDKEGRRQALTVCGMLMHSSLAVTTDGVPLGLAAVKFWTRSKFKGCNALKKSINPTRVPIEEKESYRWLENLRQSTTLFRDPNRCVHIGDRESDIYELFCAAHDMRTHFLVRTCVDRLAGDGEHTIADEMEEVRVKGLHRVQTTDQRGNVTEAVLEIKYHHLTVLPPIGKQKRYPALNLTVIHAQEKTEPIGRKRIEWKLVTDLPVASRRDAIEKLDWYAMRWKIETFHKILKSGCKVEESRLRTADRLANLVSIFCILSWRVFWITMINRSMPEALPEMALTQAEIELLNHFVKDNKRSSHAPPLSRYLFKIAQLGGYLARANDPPPGITVMWRGLRRLTDIQLGFSLAAQSCG